MGKRKPMKPMYRTAAEEALILAAIEENRARGLFYTTVGRPSEPVYADAYDAAKAEYIKAIRAVVREREEATK